MRLDKINKKSILVLIAVILLASIVFAAKPPNMKDVDKDGDIDILLNELARNDGANFTKISLISGLGDISNASYGFFIDVNNDTYYDIYLVYNSSPNKIFLNNGSAYFTDISSAANATGNSTDALGANTADFNNDDCADLFAANKLFLGNCDGTFNESTALANLGYDEVPRLEEVITADFNFDDAADILGVSENKTLILMLNLGDNNADNVPEFWDATDISLLSNLTSGVSFNSVAANVYYNHNVSGTIYQSIGLYLARDGPNMLLDTYFSSEVVVPKYLDIPVFRDISAESGTDNTGNSSCAVIMDLDNNTVADLFVANYEGNNTIYLSGSGYNQSLPIINFTEDDDLGDLRNITNITFCTAVLGMGSGFIPFGNVNGVYVSTISNYEPHKFIGDIDAGYMDCVGGTPGPGDEFLFGINDFGIADAGYESSATYECNVTPGNIYDFNEIIQTPPPTWPRINETDKDSEEDPYLFINTSVTDLIHNISSCWLEWTDNIAIDDNITMNLSGAGKDVSCWINVTNATGPYPDGNYTFRACANNSLGNKNCTAYNWTIFDTTPPNVTIISPLNGSSHTAGTIIFTINVTDNIQTRNVTLIINNSANVTVYNATKNASIQTFDPTLSAGTYSYSAIAYDASGKWSTDNGTIIVNPPISPPTGGGGPSKPPTAPPTEEAPPIERIPRPTPACYFDYDPAPPIYDPFGPDCGDMNIDFKAVYCDVYDASIGLEVTDVLYSKQIGGFGGTFSSLYSSPTIFAGWGSKDSYGIAINTKPQPSNIFIGQGGKGEPARAATSLVQKADLVGGEQVHKGWYFNILTPGEYKVEFNVNGTSADGQQVITKKETTITVNEKHDFDAYADAQVSGSDALVYIYFNIPAADGWIEYSFSEPLSVNDEYLPGKKLPSSLTGLTGLYDAIFKGARTGFAELQYINPEQTTLGFVSYETTTDFLEKYPLLNIKYHASPEVNVNFMFNPANGAFAPAQANAFGAATAQYNLDYCVKGCECAENKTYFNITHPREIEGTPPMGGPAPGVDLIIEGFDLTVTESAPYIAILNPTDKPVNLGDYYLAGTIYYPPEPEEGIPAIEIPEPTPKSPLVEVIEKIFTPTRYTPSTRDRARSRGYKPAPEDEILMRKPQCDDSIDNDADSYVDFPYDPGCKNKFDDDESNPINLETATGLKPCSIIPPIYILMAVLAALIAAGIVYSKDKKLRKLFLGLTLALFGAEMCLIGFFYYLSELLEPLWITSSIVLAATAAVLYYNAYRNPNRNYLLAAFDATAASLLNYIYYSTICTDRLPHILTSFAQSLALSAALVTAVILYHRHYSNKKPAHKKFPKFTTILTAGLAALGILTSGYYTSHLGCSWLNLLGIFGITTLIAVIIYKYVISKQLQKKQKVLRVLLALFIAVIIVMTTPAQAAEANPAIDLENDEAVMPAFLGEPLEPEFADMENDTLPAVMSAPVISAPPPAVDTSAIEFESFNIKLTNITIEPGQVATVALTGADDFYKSYNVKPTLVRIPAQITLFDRLNPFRAPIIFSSSMLVTEEPFDILPINVTPESMVALYKRTEQYGITESKAVDIADFTGNEKEVFGIKPLIAVESSAEGISSNLLTGEAVAELEPLPEYEYIKIPESGEAEIPPEILEIFETSPAETYGAVYSAPIDFELFYQETPYTIADGLNFGLFTAARMDIISRLAYGRRYLEKSKQEYKAEEQLILNGDLTLTKVNNDGSSVTYNLDKNNIEAVAGTTDRHGNDFSYGYTRDEIIVKQSNGDERHIDRNTGNQKYHILDGLKYDVEETGDRLILHGEDGSTQIRLKENNQLLSETTPEGERIEYEYVDDKTIERYEDGSFTIYDNKERILSSTDAEGGVTTHDYIGNRTIITYPDGTQITIDTETNQLEDFTVIKKYTTTYPEGYYNVTGPLVIKTEDNATLVFDKETNNLLETYQDNKKCIYEYNVPLPYDISEPIPTLLGEAVSYVIPEAGEENIILPAITGEAVAESDELILANYTSLEQCNEACMAKGYNKGSGEWQDWMPELEKENIGSYLDGSRHCSNAGQCSCYCYNLPEIVLPEEAPPSGRYTKITCTDNTVVFTDETGRVAASIDADGTINKYAYYEIDLARTAEPKISAVTAKAAAGSVEVPELKVRLMVITNPYATKVLTEDDSQLLSYIDSKGKIYIYDYREDGVYVITKDETQVLDLETNDVIYTIRTEEECNETTDEQGNVTEECWDIEVIEDYAHAGGFTIITRRDTGESYTLNENGYIIKRRLVTEDGNVTEFETPISYEKWARCDIVESSEREEKPSAATIKSIEETAFETTYEYLYEVPGQIVDCSWTEEPAEEIEPGECPDLTQLIGCPAGTQLRIVKNADNCDVPVCIKPPQLTMLGEPVSIVLPEAEEETTQIVPITTNASIQTQIPETKTKTVPVNLLQAAVPAAAQPAPATPTYEVVPYTPDFGELKLDPNIQQQAAAAKQQQLPKQKYAPPIPQGIPTDPEKIELEHEKLDHELGPADYNENIQYNDEKVGKVNKGEARKYWIKPAKYDESRATIQVEQMMDKDAGTPYTILSAELKEIKSGRLKEPAEPFQLSAISSRSKEVLRTYNDPTGSRRKQGIIDEIKNVDNLVAQAEQNLAEVQAAAGQGKATPEQIQQAQAQLGHYRNIQGMDAKQREAHINTQQNLVNSELERTSPKQMAIDLKSKLNSVEADIKDLERLRESADQGIKALKKTVEDHATLNPGRYPRPGTLQPHVTKLGAAANHERELMDKYYTKALEEYEKLEPLLKDFNKVVSTASNFEKPPSESVQDVCASALKVMDKLAIVTNLAADVRYVNLRLQDHQLRNIRVISCAYTPWCENAAAPEPELPPEPVIEKEEEFVPEAPAPVIETMPGALPPDLRKGCEAHCDMLYKDALKKVMQGEIATQAGIEQREADVGKLQDDKEECVKNCICIEECLKETKSAEGCNEKCFKSAKRPPAKPNKVKEEEEEKKKKAEFLEKAEEKLKEANEKAKKVEEAVDNIEKKTEELATADGLVWDESKKEWVQGEKNEEGKWVNKETGELVNNNGELILPPELIEPADKEELDRLYKEYQKAKAEYDQAYGEFKKTLTDAGWTIKEGKLVKLPTEQEQRALEQARSNVESLTKQLNEANARKEADDSRLAELNREIEEQKSFVEGLQEPYSPLVENLKDKYGVSDEGLVDRYGEMESWEIEAVEKYLKQKAQFNITEMDAAQKLDELNEAKKTLELEREGLSNKAVELGGELNDAKSNLKELEKLTDLELVSMTQSGGIARTSSGDLVVIDKNRNSHLVDPKTGIAIDKVTGIGYAPTAEGTIEEVSGQEIAERTIAGYAENYAGLIQKVNTGQKVTSADATKALNELRELRQRLREKELDKTLESLENYRDYLEKQEAIEVRAEEIAKVMEEKTKEISKVYEKLKEHENEGVAVVELEALKKEYGDEPFIVIADGVEKEITISDLIDELNQKIVLRKIEDIPVLHPRDYGAQGEAYARLLEDPAVQENAELQKLIINKIMEVIPQKDKQAIEEAIKDPRVQDILQRTQEFNRQVKELTDKFSAGIINKDQLAEGVAFWSKAYLEDLERFTRDPESMEALRHAVKKLKEYKPETNEYKIIAATMGVVLEDMILKRAEEIIANKEFVQDIEEATKIIDKEVLGREDLEKYIEATVKALEEFAEKLRNIHGLSKELTPAQILEQFTEVKVPSLRDPKEEVKLNEFYNELKKLSIDEAYAAVKTVKLLEEAVELVMIGGKIHQIYRPEAISILQEAMAKDPKAKQFYEKKIQEIKQLWDKAREDLRANAEEIEQRISRLPELEKELEEAASKSRGFFSLPDKETKRKLEERIAELQYELPQIKELIGQEFGLKLDSYLIGLTDDERREFLDNLELDFDRAVRRLKDQIKKYEDEDWDIKEDWEKVHEIEFEAPWGKYRLFTNKESNIEIVTIELYKRLAAVDPRFAERAIEGAEQRLGWIIGENAGTGDAGWLANEWIKDDSSMRRLLREKEGLKALIFTLKTQENFRKGIIGESNVHQILQERINKLAKEIEAVQTRIEKLAKEEHSGGTISKWFDSANTRGILEKQRDLLINELEIELNRMVRHLYQTQEYSEEMMPEQLRSRLRLRELALRTKATLMLLKYSQYYHIDESTSVAGWIGRIWNTGGRMGPFKIIKTASRMRIFGGKHEDIFKEHERYVMEANALMSFAEFGFDLSKLTEADAKIIRELQLENVKDFSKLPIGGVTMAYETGSMFTSSGLENLIDPLFNVEALLLMKGVSAVINRAALLAKGALKGIFVTGAAKAGEYMLSSGALIPRMAGKVLKAISKASEWIGEKILSPVFTVVTYPYEISNNLENWMRTGLTSRLTKLFPNVKILPSFKIPFTNKIFAGRTMHQLINGAVRWAAYGACELGVEEVGYVFLPAKDQLEVLYSMLKGDGRRLATSIITRLNHAQFTNVFQEYADKPAIYDHETGMVYVNEDNPLYKSFKAGEPGAFTAMKAAIAHERSHELLHKIGAIERIKIFETIRENPEWESIKEDFLRLYPQLRGRIDFDVISEMFAKLSETRYVASEVAAEQSVLDRFGDSLSPEVRDMFRHVVTSVRALEARDFKPLAKVLAMEQISKSIKVVEAIKSAKTIVNEEGVIVMGENGKLIVAIGDIHGDVNRLMQILEKNGFIEKDAQGEYQWIAAEGTVLVFTGDYVDRGPDSKAVIDRIIEIKAKAKAQGSSVVTLRGNHELLLKSGLDVLEAVQKANPELYQKVLAKIQSGLNRGIKGNSWLIEAETWGIDRNIADASFLANFLRNGGDTTIRSFIETPYFIGTLNDFINAFSTGEYAEFLNNLKYAAKIDNYFFAHSISNDVAKYANLEELGTAKDEDVLWGRPEEWNLQTLRAFLNKIGADYVVVGHSVTDTNTIETTDNFIIRIDTGLSEAYGGHGGVLRIDPSNPAATNPNNPAPITAYNENPASGRPSTVELEALFKGKSLSKVINSEIGKIAQQIWEGTLPAAKPRYTSTEKQAEQIRIQLETDFEATRLMLAAINDINWLTVSEQTIAELHAEHPEYIRGKIQQYIAKFGKLEIADLMNLLDKAGIIDPFVLQANAQALQRINAALDIIQTPGISTSPETLSNIRQALSPDARMLIEVLAKTSQINTETATDEFFSNIIESSVKNYDAPESLDITLLQEFLNKYPKGLDLGQLAQFLEETGLQENRRQEYLKTAQEINKVIATLAPAVPAANIEEKIKEAKTRWQAATDEGEKIAIEETLTEEVLNHIGNNILGPVANALGVNTEDIEVVVTPTAKERYIKLEFQDKLNNNRIIFSQFVSTDIEQYLPEDYHGAFGLIFVDVKVENNYRDKGIYSLIEAQLSEISKYYDIFGIYSMINPITANTALKLGLQFYEHYKSYSISSVAVENAIKETFRESAEAAERREVWDEYRLQAEFAFQLQQQGILSQDQPILAATPLIKEALPVVEMPAPVGPPTPISITDFSDADARLEAIIQVESENLKNPATRAEAVERIKTEIRNLETMVQETKRVLTDDDKVAAGIYEKLTNILMNAEQNGRAEVAMVNLPIAFLNTETKGTEVGTAFKEMFMAMVKEGYAAAEIIGIEGSSTTFVGTRVAIAGITTSELEGILNEGFDAVKARLKERYSQYTELVDKLQISAGHTTISSTTTETEYDLEKIINRQDLAAQAAAAEKLAVEGIKEVTALAETAEKYFPALEGREQTRGNYNLVTKTDSELSYDEEAFGMDYAIDAVINIQIEEGKKKYIPPAVYNPANPQEHGRTPRLYHDIGRLNFLLQQITALLEQEVIPVENLNQLINEFREAFRNTYAKSLKDTRYSNAFKFSAMSHVIEEFSKAVDLELLEEIYGTENTGFFMTKLGDEIGLVYRVDGKFILTFVELDKFNAFNEEYTPDNTDSYYHGILDTIHGVAAEMNLREGVTAEQNREFLERLIKEISNTEVMQPDGSIAAINEMEFQPTEKIEGRRIFQWVMPDGTIVTSETQPEGSAPHMITMTASVTANQQTEVTSANFEDIFNALSRLNALQKARIGRGMFFEASEIRALEETITKEVIEVDYDEQLGNVIDATSQAMVDEDVIYTAYNGVHGKTYVKSSEAVIEARFESLKEKNPDLTKDPFWIHYRSRYVPLGKGARFYLNAKAEYADSLFIEIINSLEEEGIQFSIKTAADPKHYIRWDNTVVYYAKKDAARIASIINEILDSRQFMDAANEEVPLFTKKLAKGFSYADGVPSRFVEDYSFGMLRAEAIAKAINYARRNNIVDKDRIIQEIKKEFERYDINPEKPYLNTNENDPFETPEDETTFAVRLELAENSLADALAVKEHTPEEIYILIKEHSMALFSSLDEERFNNYFANPGGYTRSLGESNSLNIISRATDIAYEALAERYDSEQASHIIGKAMEIAKGGGPSYREAGSALMDIVFLANPVTAPIYLIVKIVDWVESRRERRALAAEGTEVVEEKVIEPGIEAPAEAVEGWNDGQKYFYAELVENGVSEERAVEIVQEQPEEIKTFFDIPDYSFLKLLAESVAKAEKGEKIIPFAPSEIKDLGEIVEVTGIHSRQGFQSKISEGTLKKDIGGFKAGTKVIIKSPDLEKYRILTFFPGVTDEVKIASEDIENEAKILQEAKDLGQIIQFIHFDMYDEPKLILESIDGESLSKYFDVELQAFYPENFAEKLEELKQITPESWKKLFRTLFRLHKAGYTHGSISPDSILVDKQGELWFVDFAFAVDLKKPEFAERREEFINRDLKAMQKIIDMIDTQTRLSLSTMFKEVQTEFEEIAEEIPAVVAKPSSQAGEASIEALLAANPVTALPYIAVKGIQALMKPKPSLEEIITAPEPGEVEKTLEEIGFVGDIIEEEYANLKEKYEGRTVRAPVSADYSLAEQLLGLTDIYSDRGYISENGRKIIRDYLGAKELTPVERQLLLDMLIHGKKILSDSKGNIVDFEGYLNDYYSYLGIKFKIVSDNLDPATKYKVFTEFILGDEALTDKQEENLWDAIYDIYLEGKSYEAVSDKLPSMEKEYLKSLEHIIKDEISIPFIEIEYQGEIKFIPVLAMPLEVESANFRPLRHDSTLLGRIFIDNREFMSTMTEMYGVLLHEIDHAVHHVLSESNYEKFYKEWKVKYDELKDKKYEALDLLELAKEEGNPEKIAEAKDNYDKASARVKQALDELKKEIEAKKELIEYDSILSEGLAKYADILFIWEQAKLYEIFSDVAVSKVAFSTVELNEYLLGSPEYAIGLLAVRYYLAKYPEMKEALYKADSAADLPHFKEVVDQVKEILGKNAEKLKSAEEKPAITGEFIHEFPAAAET